MRSLSKRAFIHWLKCFPKKPWAHFYQRTFKFSCIDQLKSIGQTIELNNFFFWPLFKFWAVLQPRTMASASRTHSAKIICTIAQKSHHSFYLKLNFHLSLINFRKRLFDSTLRSLILDHIDSRVKRRRCSKVS